MIFAAYQTHRGSRNSDILCAGTRTNTLKKKRKKKMKKQNTTKPNFIKWKCKFLSSRTLAAEFPD